MKIHLQLGTNPAVRRLFLLVALVSLFAWLASLQLLRHDWASAAAANACTYSVQLQAQPVLARPRAHRATTTRTRCLRRPAKPEAPKGYRLRRGTQTAPLDSPVEARFTVFA